LSSGRHRRLHIVPRSAARTVSGTIFHPVTAWALRQQSRTSPFSPYRLMINAKCGASVRSKTDVTTGNEGLAKIVCQYVCYLISAIYNLGVRLELARAV